MRLSASLSASSLARESFVGPLLPRHIAEDFQVAADGSGVIAQGHHEAARPEALASLAKVPALVAAAAAGQGALHFAVGLIHGVVFGREDEATVLAEDFVLVVTKDPLGTRVPAIDAAGKVGGENGEFGGAFDDEAEFFFGRAGRVFGEFSVGHVAKAGNNRLEDRVQKLVGGDGFDPSPGAVFVADTVANGLRRARLRGEFGEPARRRRAA